MTPAGRQLQKWALLNARHQPKVLRAVAQVFVAMADTADLRNATYKQECDEIGQELWDMAEEAEGAAV